MILYAISERLSNEYFEPICQQSFLTAKNELAEESLSICWMDEYSERERDQVDNCVKYAIDFFKVFH